MSATGKSSFGSQPAANGYQPTQAAQSTFQSGVAQQQPGTAQQLAQIAGTSSPAVNPMVTQQMAPQGATGPAPVSTTPPASPPVYTPDFNQSAAGGAQQDPNGQQLDISGQLGYGPYEGRGFGPNPGDINPDTGQINPQPGSQQDPYGSLLLQAPTAEQQQQQRQQAAQTYLQRNPYDPSQGGTQDLYNRYADYAANLNYQAGPIFSNAVRMPDSYSDWLKQQPGQQPITAQPVGQPITAQPVGQPITMPNGQQLDLNPPAPQPTSLMPAPQPVAQPAPAPQPVAQPTPAPVIRNPLVPPSAPVAQPIAKPIAQPIAKPVAQPIAKPAPMPTKATQGYVSRVAPKPTAPMPVARPAPMPVVKPATPSGQVSKSMVPFKPYMTTASGRGTK